MRCVFDSDTDEQSLERKRCVVFLSCYSLNEYAVVVKSRIGYKFII